MHPTRRVLLQTMGLAAACVGITPSFVFAATPKDARLVVIILRGAIDGLSVVVPYGDPDYAAARGAIAIGRPGTENGALTLTSEFGLHPSLAQLHKRYAAGELIAFHAVATPYRERSHFDGQDVLENGTSKPYGTQDGWLNRALVGADRSSAKPVGLAVGQTVPLILRGPASVTSWAPEVLPAVDEDTLNRLMDLYAQDKVLGPALARAVATNALLSEMPAKGASSDDDVSRSMANPGQAAANPARYAAGVARSVGTLLAAPDGPCVAVIDLTGWDTHANESGALAQRLAALDAGLEALSEGLGSTWSHTAVLIVTEFGRTVAINGTNGTDHGTGTMSLLVGGRVAGGRVVAEWPGLSTSALLAGRDLKPTLDLRAVSKGVLADHLGVDNSQLAARVFPGSDSVTPMRGLIRA